MGTDQFLGLHCVALCIDLGSADFADLASDETLDDIDFEQLTADDTERRRAGSLTQKIRHIASVLLLKQLPQLSHNVIRAQFCSTELKTNVIFWDVMNQTMREIVTSVKVLSLDGCRKAL